MEMVFFLIKKFFYICTATLAVLLLLIVLFFGTLWFTPLSFSFLIPPLSAVLYSQTGLAVNTDTFDVSLEENVLSFTLTGFQLLCDTHTSVVYTKSINVSFTTTTTTSSWIDISLTLDTPTVFLSRTPKGTVMLGVSTDSDTSTQSACEGLFIEKTDQERSQEQFYTWGRQFIQEKTAPFVALLSVNVQDVLFRIDDQKFRDMKVIHGSLDTSLVNNTLEELHFILRTSESRITTRIQKIAQTSIFSLIFRADPLHADVLSLILPIQRRLEHLMFAGTVEARISSTDTIGLEEASIKFGLLESEQIHFFSEIFPNPVDMESMNIDVTYDAQTTSFSIKTLDIALHHTDPLQVGLTGNLSLDFPLLLMPFRFTPDTAKWNLQLRHAEQTNVVTGTLFSSVQKKLVIVSVKNFTPMVFSRIHPVFSVLENFSSSLDVSVVANLSNDYMPISTRLTFNANEGSFFIPLFFEDTLSFSTFSFTIHLEDFQERYIPYRVRLPEFMITFASSVPDKERELSGRFELRRDWERLFLGIEVSGKNIDVRQTAQLWPFQILSPGYEWTRKNVFEGMVGELSIVFDGSVPLFEDQERVLLPKFDANELIIEDVQISFTATDLTLNYIDGLPFANDVSVRGIGDKKFVTIEVQQGVSGGVYNRGGEVVLGHHDEKGQPLLRGRFLIEGNVLPSIELLKRLPEDVTKDLRKVMMFQQGSQETELWLVFPLVPEPPEEEIKIRVNTTLTGLKATINPKGPVLGDITGTFQFAENKFTGRLRGLVDHLPSNFLLKGYIENKQAWTTLLMTAVLTPTDVKLLKLPFHDMIAGTLDAKVTMRFLPNDVVTGRAVVDGTNTALLIPVVNHSKPYGDPASLAIDFYMKDDKMYMEDLILRASDIFLSGSGVFSPLQSRLEWFDVSSLYVGETILQGKVRRVGEGYYLQSYYSPRLNVEQILATLLKPPQHGIQNSQAEQSTPTVTPPEFSFTDTKLDDDILFTVEVSELLFGGSKTVLRDVIIRLDHRDRQWYQLQVTAKNNDNQPIMELQFIPRMDEQHEITFEVKDLGYMLTQFDITDSIVKGNTILQGILLKNEERMQFRGKVDLLNYKIVNLPIFVQLLNFLGPLGIVELLVSDGLLFERLTTSIAWQDDCLVLRDALTMGTSVRLSLSEAVVNLAEKTIRVAGHIGILEILNKIGDLILWPFVGDEGLFATAFSIEGQYEDPVISIHPLSILTPGILGEIFTRASDSLFNFGSEEDITCQDIF